MANVGIQRQRNLIGVNDMSIGIADGKVSSSVRTVGFSAPMATGLMRGMYASSG